MISLSCIIQNVKRSLIVFGVSYAVSREIISSEFMDTHEIWRIRERIERIQSLLLFPWFGNAMRSWSTDWASYGILLIFYNPDSGLISLIFFNFSLGLAIFCCCFVKRHLTDILLIKAEMLWMQRVLFHVCKRIIDILVSFSGNISGNFLIIYFDIFQAKECSSFLCFIILSW